MSNQSILADFSDHLFKIGDVVCFKPHMQCRGVIVARGINQNAAGALARNYLVSGFGGPGTTGLHHEVELVEPPESSLGIE